MESSRCHYRTACTAASFEDFAVRIATPAFSYAPLSGDCNNVPEDDFSNAAGIILSGETEFLQAWDLEADEEDYEDGSGLDQMTPNPLDPWGLGPITGGQKGSKTTAPSVKSTLNPLAPWNLGPLGVGIKGPDINVAPGQSTISPLSPWNKNREPTVFSRTLCN